MSYPIRLPRPEVSPSRSTQRREVTTEGIRREHLHADVDIETLVVARALVVEDLVGIIVEPHLELVVVAPAAAALASKIVLDLAGALAGGSELDKSG